MTSVVINRCFGGFGLSNVAFERYLDLKGIAWYKNISEWGGRQHYTINDEYLSKSDIERDDPILVQVVEEMGEESWGDFAELKVVEIPDDASAWKIDEYDGMESIHECHRSWS